MATHEKLRQNVQLHDGHVQALKATMVTHAIDVGEMEQQVEGLRSKVVEVLSTIRDIMVKLHDMASLLLPELFRALPESDRTLLKEQLPTLMDVENPNEDEGPSSKPAPEKRLALPKNAISF